MDAKSCMDEKDGVSVAENTESYTKSMSQKKR